MEPTERISYSIFKTLITADEAMIRKLTGHSIVVPLKELEFRG